MILQGLRDKWPALLRFAAGGVLSAGVTLGVTALLHEVFGFPEPQAAALAMLAALSVNYAFLRYVAFRGTQLPWRRQLVLFLASDEAAWITGGTYSIDGGRALTCAR